MLLAVALLTCLLVLGLMRERVWVLLLRTNLQQSGLRTSTHCLGQKITILPQELLLTTGLFCGVHTNKGMRRVQQKAAMYVDPARCATPSTPVTCIGMTP